MVVDLWDQVHEVHSWSVTNVTFLCAISKISLTGDTKSIGFNSILGTISKSEIFVSQADQRAGVNPIVWQIDLKRTHSLPSDYIVNIIDYSVRGDRVFATYNVYTNQKEYVETLEGEWDVTTGFPRKRFSE